jgi:hypothetical protein
MPSALSGSGGHTATFNVVRVLLHGFGFSTEAARSILEEYNSRCEPPWSQAELEHKLRSVDGLQSKFPRGYLIGDGPQFPSAATRQATGRTTETETKKKIEFDAGKLAELAKPWDEIVDLVWLANRSAADPALVGPAEFLRALYPSGEKILCFTQQFSQGEALWPAEQPPGTGKEGVWFLPQPVCGESRPNPDGKERLDGSVPTSRRTWRCVEEFRYLLIESDVADPRAWLGFIVQVPLRIEALYTSGGRSIHALVRVDCRTKEEWDEEKRGLMPFLMGCVMVGGDRGTWSAVRLSRLPGALREGKTGEDDRYKAYATPKLQKLLYLRPGAAVRPICELPAVRDVEASWLGLAALGVSDADETGGAYLKRGLSYYANVSERCKLALAKNFNPENP